MLSDPVNEFDRVKAAIREHGPDLARYPGVVKVQPGYAFVRGRPTDQPAVEVLVDRKLPAAAVPAAAMVPSEVAGVRVDVRQATVEEQLELAGRARPEAEPAAALAGLAAAAGVVDDRTPVEQETGAAPEAELVEYEPPPFDFEPVDEEMRVVLHVSPDAGFPQLKRFLAANARRLRATIFEFEADHVRDALLNALGDDGRMDFVMHRRGRNPEFAQDLKDELGDRLAFAWAAAANTNAVTEGWFPTSYHIKVIVRDRRRLWLSSGNWKESGQPKADPAGQPASFLRNHNREWHVIADSPGLARQFDDLVRFDLEQAAAVQAPGAEPEAEMPDVFVPAGAAPEAEWEPIAPLTLDKRLRVVPLVSPDNFIREITRFVKRATRRLYIQNQYIWPTTDSRWRELNEFVRDFSKRPDVDFKVIVRDQSLPKTIRLMREMRFGMADVKQLRNTHTKGIIVDDLGVAVGSHNWSGDGFLANRDATLIFDDPEAIAYFEAVFLFDYERASELELNRPEAEPRLAPPGEAPPPGMRRVSWSEYTDD